MIKEIEVDTFLKYMGQGISRPVLVIGDDYNEYILKNEKIDNGGNLTNYNCMFLNELLSYQIGRYIGVPMPEAAIAFVDNKFTTDEPLVRFAYRFEEGRYFASEKLKYLENNIMENSKQLIMMNKPYIIRTWKNFFSNIDNKYSVSDIVAFDILIANFDRYNNVGNVLICNDEKSRNLFAIDHGHAFFGPIWDQKKINCFKQVAMTNDYINAYANLIWNNMHGELSGAGVIFKALEEYINLEDLQQHSFLNVVQKIENISENMLDVWLHTIPNEWYIDESLQMTYYKKFILQQKDIVRYIIQNMAERNAFTNYKGGKLEWKNREIQSHTAL